MTETMDVELPEIDPAAPESEPEKWPKLVSIVVDGTNKYARKATSVTDRLQAGGHGRGEICQRALSFRRPREKTEVIDLRRLDVGGFLHGEWRLGTLRP